MDNTWLIQEPEFTPSAIGPQEAVFTIGNGNLSTRGTFEEGFSGCDDVTLVHGVFDDVPTVMTELANVPSWLPLAVYIEGEKVSLDAGEILSYERTLDMRTGVLTRSFRWRSPGNRTVDVRYERFTSLADPHVLALRCQVTPVDFSGTVEVRAALDGHVDNAGVRHWLKVKQGEQGERTVFLESRTRGTGLLLAEAAWLDVRGASAKYTLHPIENCPTIVARWTAQTGQTVTVDKVVSLYTAHDAGRKTCEAALAKLAEVQATPDAYDRLLAASSHAWAEVWDAADVIIEGDDEAQRAIRYSLFQLFIAAPQADPFVSIAAKTMSGFGYRGHVFWDTEIFILPVFTYTHPAIARNLLLYRYHTLGGARAKAREAGLDGAQYPWEAALTGEEVTPRFVPGPAGKDVRIWTGDIELHISSDIAYAVWQYWQATGDDDFMLQYGAEMILDTAVFWASRVEWEPEKNRYEISDVIGPDEYHEHVDNNVYTNYLARWHLGLAQAVLNWLRHSAPAKAAELVERLALTGARLEKWRDIIAKIYILQDPTTRLFEQFEGYFQRRDVDLAAMEPRSRSVQALLGIEETNETQVLKQPDVLMLFYLLPDEFDAQTMRVNWDYYTPRTDLTHGSSLAPGIQAILACRMGDADMAYPFFMQAALIDLHDLRLNTRDGIHGAAAGAAWQAVVLGFGGLRVTENSLTTQARLPKHWKRLAFKVWHKGELKSFSFEGIGNI